MAAFFFPIRDCTRMRRSHMGARQDCCTCNLTTAYRIVVMLRTVVHTQGTIFPFS